jgi:hypothetical protein
MARLTQAQHDRQRRREMGTGRYTRHNACELCGRGVGADYSSDRRANDTGMGLVLHDKCARVLDLVPDAEYEGVLTMASGLSDTDAKALPAHLLDRLAAGRAGCVSLAFARRGQGALVGVYRGEEAGLEAPWAAVCESHGAVLLTDNKRGATSSASHPEDWCADCRSEE